MAQSLAEQLACLPQADQDRYYAGLTDPEAEALLADWLFWGRPEQHSPDWLWRWWLILTGRGWGKNRTAAEWVVDRCELFAAAGMEHLVGLIGQNNDDVKALQIGGVSGLREVVRRRGHRWIGAKTTLEPQIGIQRDDGTWHYSQIEVHTAENPEGPRGRNFHTLWVDELAAYKHKTDAVGNTVFTNAELALRGTCPPGEIPRAVVTTTPKPIPVIRDLNGKKHGPTHVTRGSMFDNRANLPPEFIQAIIGRYAGTRLAAQEIEGALIDSVEGALWTPDIIHAWRVQPAQVPDLARVVVAVDPSGSEEGDECGIVVVGLARETDGLGRQHVYVLADESVQNRPEVWGHIVVDTFHKHMADYPNATIEVVGEVNFGAALVVDVVHLIDKAVPFHEVRASRGKRVRAEPVALLYDRGQGRCHHVGVFPQLEEQMCFAAGTTILTASGEQPIEAISPGTLVATREGWRPVRHAWCSGRRQTLSVTLSSGVTIRCTPDHPLWVDGHGWTPAGEVQTGARLSECRTPSSAPTSSSTACGTSSLATATTGPAEAAAAASTTGTSTRRSMARSLPAGRSTMATTTEATMTPPTSSPCPSPLTVENTPAGRWVPNSVDESLSGSADGGSSASLSSGPAGSAEDRSSRGDSGPRFAPTAVVLSVAANEGIEPVYDLEVGGCHEFVAGGILAHNCYWTPLDPTSPDRMDALVWGCSALLPDLTIPPADYVKGFAERPLAA